MLGVLEFKPDTALAVRKPRGFLGFRRVNCTMVDIGQNALTKIINVAATGPFAGEDAGPRQFMNLGSREYRSHDATASPLTRSEGGSGSGSPRIEAIWASTVGHRGRFYQIRN